MADIGQQLLNHLRSLGIEASLREREALWSERTRSSFGENILPTKSLGLPDLDVSIGRISSVRVVRVEWEHYGLTWKVPGFPLSWQYPYPHTDSELRIAYTMKFDSGLVLPLGIEATTMWNRNLLGRTRSLVWHAFPLIGNRLNGDALLNSRLLARAGKDLVGDLRIVELPGNRMGILTKYHRRRLPSRELLACIRDIAGHIDDAVVERNRHRNTERN